MSNIKISAYYVCHALETGRQRLTRLDTILDLGLDALWTPIHPTQEDFVNACNNNSLELAVEPNGMLPSELRTMAAKYPAIKRVIAVDDAHTMSPGEALQIATYCAEQSGLEPITSVAPNPEQPDVISRYCQAPQNLALQLYCYRWLPATEWVHDTCRDAIARTTANVIATLQLIPSNPILDAGRQDYPPEDYIRTCTWLAIAAGCREICYYSLCDAGGMDAAQPPVNTPAWEMRHWIAAHARRNALRRILADVRRYDHLLIGGLTPSSPVGNPDRRQFLSPMRNGQQLLLDVSGCHTIWPTATLKLLITENRVVSPAPLSGIAKAPGRTIDATIDLSANARLSVTVPAPGCDVPYTVAPPPFATNITTTIAIF